jgi:hypothetical protein
MKQAKMRYRGTPANRKVGGMNPRSRIICPSIPVFTATSATMRSSTPKNTDLAKARFPVSLSRSVEIVGMSISFGRILSMFFANPSFRRGRLREKLSKVAFEDFRALLTCAVRFLMRDLV